MPAYRTSGGASGNSHNAVSDTATVSALPATVRPQCDRSHHRVVRLEPVVQLLGTRR